VAKKWIAKAIKHPGAFKAKAKAAGMSTREFASKHDDEGGKTGKQARLAETLMGMSKRKKLYDHPRSERTRNG
jgi:hypothetical protein